MYNKRRPFSADELHLTAVLSALLRDRRQWAAVIVRPLQNNPVFNCQNPVKVVLLRVDEVDLNAMFYNRSNHS